MTKLIWTTSLHPVNPYIYKLPGKDYEFYGIENRQKLNNHLYAIKQPNGQVIGSDYFQGEDVVVTYSKNSKPLFASITNPAPSDWSGTPTDFAVKVLNQNGSKIDLKVFTNYDPYTITEHTTWDGQIFLEESVTIQSGAKLTIKPGTTMYLDEGVGINVSGELHASSTIFTAMDTNWGR